MPEEDQRAEIGVLISDTETSAASRLYIIWAKFAPSQFEDIVKDVTEFKNALAKKGYQPEEDFLAKNDKDVLAIADNQGIKESLTEVCSDSDNRLTIIFNKDKTYVAVPFTRPDGFVDAQMFDADFLQSVIEINTDVSHPSH